MSYIMSRYFAMQTLTIISSLIVSNDVNALRQLNDIDIQHDIYQMFSPIVYQCSDITIIVLTVPAIADV